MFNNRVRKCFNFSRSDAKNEPNRERVKNKQVKINKKK